MKAIITVVGHDKVGIIFKVSEILAKNNINILDISQTIMQNMFTMIMLVDVSGASVSFDKISGILDTLGTELGLSIKIQHENIFNSIHRI